MGGKTTKTIKIKARANRFLPAEVFIEAILVGIGLFEAAVFILGGMSGQLEFWPMIIGAIYFVLPYNLVMTGFVIPGRFISLGDWQRNLAIVLLNLPFVVYLAWIGDTTDNAILGGLILLGLLYNMPKVRLRNIPGLDVVSLALFMAGPFIYGVSLAGVDELWWLGAWLSMLMIIAANYLMYKLPMIGFDRQVHYDGTDVRLGVEYSLVAALGLYFAAAILPIISYGWVGVPPSVLIMWYMVVAFQAIPYRLIAGSAGLYRIWRAIWWLNYPIGSLIVIYAAVLISGRP